MKILAAEFCLTCDESNGERIDSYPATVGYVETFKCPEGHKWSVGWSDE